MKSSQQDVYDQFIAEVYDFVEPYRLRDDIDFFVEEASSAGDEVLEIGCGTGRILIPIARAGIKITGLDLSENMLNICRHKLQNEPESIRKNAKLVHADMRDFDLKRRFSLIALPFRPFQHLLTVPDQMASLTTIHRHLKPEGRMILDVFYPSLKILHETKEGEIMGEEPEFEMPDGRLIKRFHRITKKHPIDQVNEVEIVYEIKQPGRAEISRIVHAFPMRYLYRFEAEHLLARCGFRIDKIYSDYRKHELGEVPLQEMVIIVSPE